MNKTPKVIYKFSGHETFVFRYGWLEKGVRAVAQDPLVFSKEDAIVRLGVGKNMVESIRHWSLVTQMIEEDTSQMQRGARHMRVAPLAQKLLLFGGWDPFLENDASLWLIHWMLVSNSRIATTWQIAFFLFQRTNFTKQELLNYLMSYTEHNSVKVHQSSMHRDVDCFLRTYAPTKPTKKQVVLEESFVCPFQELGLIHLSPDGELYHFAIGAKPSLPSAVFGFALAHYFDNTRSGLNTMSVQECLYGSGSPGQAFKLDENSLIEYIEELEKSTGGKVALDETAGLKQIYRRENLEAFTLLEEYYTMEVQK